MSYWAIGDVEFITETTVDEAVNRHLYYHPQPSASVYVREYRPVKLGKLRSGDILEMYLGFLDENYRNYEECDPTEPTDAMLNIERDLLDCISELYEPAELEPTGRVEWIDIAEWLRRIKKEVPDDAQ